MTSTTDRRQAAENTAAALDYLSDRPRSEQLEGLADLADEGRQGWADKAAAFLAEGQADKAAAADNLSRVAAETAARYRAEAVVAEAEEYREDRRRYLAAARADKAAADRKAADLAEDLAEAQADAILAAEDLAAAVAADLAAADEAASARRLLAVVTAEARR